MLKFNQDVMKQLYRMQYIVRYNTWPKVNLENVATHSFFTALFTMMITNEMKLDSLTQFKAIQVALVHDIPETVTNDITYDAKVAMPEIEELLLVYEKRFVKDNFPYIYNSMYNVEKTELTKRFSFHLIPMIVTLADILSAYQYCINEVELGNKHFIPVLENSKKRVKEMINMIEKEGYKCPEIII